MRNFITSTLAMLLFFSVSFAQTSGQVTLNIELHPVLAIQVNELQKPVNLVYNTAENYTAGVSSDNPDHITVFGTHGFKVSVKSSTPELQSAGQSTTVGGIILTSTAGTNASQETTPQSINLSGVDQTLFSSSTGVGNGKYNVKYDGLGNSAYINKGQGDGIVVYTTEVLYTITTL